MMNNDCRNIIEAAVEATAEFLNKAVPNVQVAKTRKCLSWIS